MAEQQQVGGVPMGWRETKLGDIINLKRGYDLPQDKRQIGDIPIVSSAGITGFHSSAMAKAPGVVTGRYGTLGEIFYINEDFWPLNTTLYVQDFKGSHPRFIAYFLQTLGFGGGNDKSSVPGLNRNDLHRIPVACPPLPEQKAIAAILGALDDKIETNRKMNATLEGIARALFKSWFVDFYPVRAKAEGRPSGLPADLDALFPASFTDSPLGEIPMGWRVERFGDFIERMPSGKKYDKKNTFSEGKVPVLDQGKSGIIGYHNQEPDIIASEENPLFTFANHTCYMRWVFTPSSAIQNVIPLMGKNVPIYFAYYATTEVQQFQEYKGHWPDFIRHHAIIPSLEIMNIFSSMVKPAVQKQFMLEQQNQTLATLRDTLLPKLISGQIRVKDAEKIMGKAL